MPIIQTHKPLKPRPKNDFYPTPLPFAATALNGLPKWFQPHFVLDPGCGDGVWGRANKRKWASIKFMDGVEFDNSFFVKNKNNDLNCWLFYDEIYHADFCKWSSDGMTYDLVCGNPPYRYAEEFIRKGMSLLVPGGFLVFLLRTHFLGSAKRLKLWEDFPPWKIAICANRPSFTGDGKTDADVYCFMYWQKGYAGETKTEWVLVPKEV